MVLTRYARWNTRTLALGSRFPNDAGILPDGKLWILYSTIYDSPKMVWVDGGGQSQMPVDYPYGSGYFAGISIDGLVYLCGSGKTDTVECRANPAGAIQPLWKLSLEQGGQVIGSALANNRLYAVLENGSLFAIGSREP